MRRKRQREESERQWKDCCFARRRLRTQMRRRYFVRFPVGVWPPGAAPTSACFSGYKLTAEPGHRCCWVQEEGIVGRLHWGAFLLPFLVLKANCICLSAASKNKLLHTKADYLEPGHMRDSLHSNVLLWTMAGKGGLLVLAITLCVLTSSRFLVCALLCVCIRCVTMWADIITPYTLTPGAHPVDPGQAKAARFAIKEGTSPNKHHL